MRASGRLAVLAAASALGGAPFAAGAQSLPPPPYQTSAQAGDQGFGPDLGQAPSGQQAIDRYGGGYRRTPAIARQPTDPGASPYAPPGPRLAWAGKTETQAQPGAEAQAGGWSTMGGHWDAAPEAQARGRAAQMAAPTNAWRPLYPLTAHRAEAAPAPTSIYDAPQQTAAAPAPRPYQQAQAAPNAQGGPHFYSLHRDYGIQPDPIPLPPQFFGPTADLSAPATDPLSKRTTIVNGQTKTVNVPDDQGAQ